MIENLEGVVREGEIIEYHDQRDSWSIKRNGVVEEYTTHYIEYARDLFVDDEMEYLWRETEMKICSECRSEAFFDREKDEYYCPMCEQ